MGVDVRLVEELAIPAQTAVLVSVGSPQMQSKPFVIKGSPPEYIKQALGWNYEKNGFACRYFKADTKKQVFKDSDMEVLVYREVMPNRSILYRALDYSYFADSEWATPVQQYLNAEEPKS